MKHASQVARHTWIVALSEALAAAFLRVTEDWQNSKRLEIRTRSGRPSTDLRSNSGARQGPEHLSQQLRSGWRAGANPPGLMAWICCGWSATHPRSNADRDCVRSTSRRGPAKRGGCGLTWRWGYADPLRLVCDTATGQRGPRLCAKHQSQRPGKERRVRFNLELGGLRTRCGWSATQPRSNADRDYVRSTSRSGAAMRGGCGLIWQ